MPEFDPNAPSEIVGQNTEFDPSLPFENVVVEDNNKTEDSDAKNIVTDDFMKGIDITTKRDATDVFTHVAAVDEDLYRYKKYTEFISKQNKNRSENLSKLGIPESLAGDPWDTSSDSEKTEIAKIISDNTGIPNNKLLQASKLNNILKVYTPLAETKDGVDDNVLYSVSHAFDAGVAGVLLQFDNSIKAVGKLMGFDPPKSPFAKMVDNLNKTKELYSPGDIVSTTIESIAQMTPEIMAYQVGMPEIGVGNLARITSGQVTHIPKFALGLGNKEFANSYQDGEDFLGAVEKGAEGFNVGLVYESMGVPAKHFGEVVYRETTNKLLSEASAATMAGSVFATHSVIDQYLNTGRVDRDAVVDAFALGVGMHGKQLFDAITTSRQQIAINSLLASDGDMILNAINSTKTIKELRQNAHDAAIRARKEPSDVLKRSSLMESQMINTLADIKAVSKDIKDNGSDKYIHTINRDKNLSQSEKDFYSSKIKRIESYQNGMSESTYEINGRTYNSKEDFIDEVVKIRESGENTSEIKVVNDKQTDSVVNDILSGDIKKYKTDSKKEGGQENAKEGKPSDETIKLSDDIDYVLNQIYKNKPIDNNVLNSAIDKLYNKLDKTQDLSDSKFIEDIINELEGYENITEIKTARVKQGATVESVRTNRKKPEEKGINHRDRTINQELSKEGADNYKFVLESDTDGLFIQSFDKSGRRSDKQRLDAKSSKDLDIGEIFFDSVGNVSGIQLIDKSGRKIRIDNPEIAIDYALEKKVRDLGEVSDPEFNKAFEIISNEYAEKAIRVKKEGEQTNAKESAQVRNEAPKAGEEQTERIGDMPSSAEQKAQEIKPEKEIKKDLTISDYDKATSRQRRDILYSEARNVEFEDSDTAKDKALKIKEHFDGMGITVNDAQSRRIFTESKKKTVTDALSEIESVPKEKRKTDYNKIILDFSKDKTNPEIVSELKKPEYRTLLNSAAKNITTEHQAKKALSKIEELIIGSNIRSVKKDIQSEISKKTTKKASAKSKERKGNIGGDSKVIMESFSSGRKMNTQELSDAIESSANFVSKSKEQERINGKKLEGLLMAQREKMIDEIDVGSAKTPDEILSRNKDLSAKLEMYDDIYEDIKRIWDTGRSEIISAEKARIEKNKETTQKVIGIITKGKVRGSYEAVTKFKDVGKTEGVEKAFSSLIDDIKNTEGFNDLSDKKKKSILSELDRLSKSKNIEIKPLTKKIEKIVGKRILDQQEAKLYTEGVIRKMKMYNINLPYENFNGLWHYLSRGNMIDTQWLLENTSNRIDNARQKYIKDVDSSTKMITEKHIKLQDELGAMYHKEWWREQSKYGFDLELDSKEVGGNLRSLEIDGLSLQQVINNYAIMRRPEIAELYKTNNKITNDSFIKFKNHINDIVNNNKILKDYAEWAVSEYYPLMYDKVNPTYKKIFGVDMPMERLYMPMSFVETGKNAKGSDIELFGSADSFGSFYSSVDAANARNRVRHNKPIDIKAGFDENITKYTTDMLYFANMAEPVRDINSILKNKDFRNAVKYNSGDQVLKLLDKHLDDIANNGRKMERDISSVWLAKQKNKFVTATLGMNPGIILTQLSSAVAYSAEVNTARFAKEMTNITENIKAMEYLAKTPVMRDRYKRGVTIDMVLAKTRDAKKIVEDKSAFSEWQMGMIKIGDGGAILLGGAPYFRIKESDYMKAQESMLKEKYKGTEGSKEIISKELKDYESTARELAYIDFAKVTNKQQQSVYVENLSAIQRSVVGNMFTSYMSSPIQYAQKINEASRNIIRGRGSVGDVKKLLMFGLTLPFLYNASKPNNWEKEERKKRYVPSEDDDSKINKIILKSIIEGSLGGRVTDVYGFKDFSSAFASGNKRWQYNAVRSYGQIEDAYVSSEKAMRALSKDDVSDAEKIDATIESIATVVSTLTGQPIENSYDLCRPIVMEMVGGDVSGNLVDYILGKTKVESKKKPYRRSFD